MMVGTYCTGEALYGPSPSRSGMQDGTKIGLEVGLFGSLHLASFMLSHPDPGFWPTPVSGLSPMNPSRSAEASSRCEPQVDGVLSWKVRSEMTYWSARLLRLGIRDRSSCSRQA